MMLHLLVCRLDILVLELTTLSSSKSGTPTFRQALVVRRTENPPIGMDSELFRWVSAIQQMHTTHHVKLCPTT